MILSYLQLFSYGMFVGATVAVPVGPIGILCLQRTFTYGPLIGFVSGMGAATADAIFSGIALWSLATFWSTLKEYQMILECIGGIVMCALGVYISTTTQKKIVEVTDNIRLMHMYFSALIITLSNPATIVVIATLMTLLSFDQYLHNTTSYILLILGIFTGSSSWWIFIGHITKKGTIHKNKNIIAWINKAAGIIIFIFGLITILKALYEIYIT